MTGHFWLSSEQLERKPYFPLSHGVPRADGLKVVSGIVFVIKNGLLWRDAHTGASERS
jgi:putative transposase